MVCSALAEPCALSPSITVAPGQSHSVHAHLYIGPTLLGELDAISDAGITKQTLYEVEKSAFTRSTYDRAIESLNAVNAEIEALIQAAWGR